MIERIKNIQQHGKTARGRKELLKHLSGQKLTLKQAVLAHCYDCVGYYADGKQDCEMPDCPLHPFMPYNTNRIRKATKNIMPGDDVEIRASRL